jgi:SAM-dependent methyltransferase
LAPGRTVVDVGAGTGKFAALLVPSGAEVVAVEPLAAMRQGFAADLAGVRVVDGSAEALPLADTSADAIVAAQAFHWFDRPRALAEFARVLRPDGRLGVIWNDIDTSVEWASEFYAIVSPGRVATPVPWSAADGDLGPWFGPRHRGSFTYAHAQDRSSLLARVDSMSWIAVRPEQEREEIKRRVGELLDTHPELAGRESFDLPYVTSVFWAERLESE